MRVRKRFISLLALLTCALFLNVSGQNPGKASWSQGEQLRQQKRYAEAIVKYDEAIKLEPTNARYHFSKGKAYYAMKDEDNALLAFEETVQHKPDFTPAYTLIAKIYIRKNDLGNAAYYFMQAFENEPNASKKVRYAMESVKIALKQGNTDQAKQYIERAKAVAPEDMNLLYYDAKISNQSGDYARARDNLVIATQKLGDAPPAQSAKFYYELGLAYNNLGDYNNATKAWEKANFGPYKKLIARERAKNSPAYFYRRAISYYMAGEYETAKGEANRALELQNDFAPAYILMGKMDRKQGNFSGAISSYQQAANMETNPEKKAKLMAMLASMQLDAGDFSGALSSANSVLGAQPTNMKIMYIKAMAQYRLGQYDSCIGTLERMLSSASIDGASKARYNFTLGMAAKNTDPEKAKEAFKRAAAGPFKAAAQNELSILLGKEG